MEAVIVVGFVVVVLALLAWMREKDDRHATEVRRLTTALLDVAGEASAAARMKPLETERLSPEEVNKMMERHIEAHQQALENAPAFSAGNPFGRTDKLAT